MNKYEEVQKIDSLFEVESGLDTRLFELAGYPLIEDLVEKMFQLKDGKLFGNYNWINDDVARTNFKNGVPSEKSLNKLMEGLNEI